MTIDLISLHGGHSGEFCCHAEDRLEDFIRQYIRLGFKRVGISEHIPPASNRFLYPDETALGLTARDLMVRFERYFKTLNALKQAYRDRITIYAGMETETTTGYTAHISKLAATFQPDYLVGSVHHVNDICFDFSASEYENAVSACGGMNPLYEAYFDLQHEMINRIRPFVVGHFDLVRIFDPDYEQRLLRPNIAKKIERNLALVKSLGLVLDFNLRPLARGETKPYIAGSILDMAREMDLCLVPGDDSHSAAEAGSHVDKAVALLKSRGFCTLWPEPKMMPMS